MRIAFSGTHRAGKSTLLEAVAAHLSGHRVVDEPYYTLEEEGYELADPPSAEDFTQQLRLSIVSIMEASADVLFDRCPLDFVAYLQALDEEWELDEWRDELVASVERLDLIVFVAIEEPDRIVVPAHEDRRLRRDVDERMRTLIIDDALDLGVATLEVTGTLDERVRQLLRALTRE